MCRKAATRLLPVLMLLGAGPALGASDELDPLWQLGRADGKADEFAFGPDGYYSYRRPGRLILPGPDPEAQWPYYHSGPAHSRTGGRRHTFEVHFFVRQLPAAGECRLTIHCVDTHPDDPPHVSVSLNDEARGHQLPAGGSKASVHGDVSAARPHRFSVTFKAEHLRTGFNELRITTTAGSWFIYDHVAFEAPPGTKLRTSPATVIESASIDPRLVARNGRRVQWARLRLAHSGPERTISVGAPGVEVRPVEQTVRAGWATVRLPLPAVAEPTARRFVVRAGGAAVARGRARQPAGRRAEPVDWVDPMIGASGSRWMLFPGPTMPFGMVKLSPDNQGQDPSRWLWKAGYEHGIDNIMGFSHIHSWTMSGLMTVSTTGPLRVRPGPAGNPDAGYRSRIDRAGETAEPGYYAVELTDYGIRAELTTTTRAGFQRYTFPRSDRARILFDQLIPSEYGAVLHEAMVRRAGDRRIEGYAKLSKPEWQRYTLHFVARVNKPFDSMGGWVGGRVQRDVDRVEGQGDVGAFLTFETEADEQILLQTAVSLVSIEQARLNLRREMGPFGWDFEACRGHARRTWNDLLGRIRVSGTTPTNLTKFYTNFYRAYSGRTIWSDVNGKYVDMHERVRQLPDPGSPIYGSDAFWNTFWNLNQLWRIATPRITDQWVRSLLEIHKRGRWLPRGPAGIEYSGIMVAEHSIPFIVGAYQHGIRGYDAGKALEAMVHAQTTPPRAHPAGGHVGNRDLAAYLEHGYVPLGEGTLSNTLEYAYDDWCVAQMARALNEGETYRKFKRRSESWRNIFDADRGLVRPYNAAGEPVEQDLAPRERRQRWTEATPRQYTWFVPQDIPGLVRAMGRRRFVRRLDGDMAESAKHDFSGFNLPINHGNQPTMHAAYLFNYAGAPWLTQKWARAIMDRYYGTGPADGWPGDEDQGQGGAWFVMSAIGLFQVDGGARRDPIFDIGSPLFDRAVIQLDGDYYDGDRFVIEAKNQSPENVYIQSAKLDGEPLGKPWFRASRLQDGGKLILRMGPEPNKQWAAGMGNVAPPEQ